VGGAAHVDGGYFNSTTDHGYGGIAVGNAA
jgi:hypothetical protein